MSTLKLLFIFGICIQVTYSSKLDYLAYKLLSELPDTYEDDSESDEKREENSNEFITFSYTLPVKNIGQIGGLATEKNGNLVVFHRASRRWEFDSFDTNNRFNNKKYEAIKENTLVELDVIGGEIVNEWGAALFYMPHGLTIDNQGNVWITDVALHQVMKFDRGNYETPSLKLGVEFENGNDETHLCKPTDIAVSSLNGDIFVSDGYCNTRVVQYDKNGKFIKEFKMNDNEEQISISHSVALIEDLNVVCAADREHGRIICFNLTSGEVETIIKNEKMHRVFAIEYNKETELLHAVSGQGNKQRPLGFTFNAAAGTVFGDFLSEWEPSIAKFEDPHDLTTTLDGQRIYTGELNGRIDEFELN